MRLSDGEKRWLRIRMQGKTRHPNVYAFGNGEDAGLIVNFFRKIDDFPGGHCLEDVMLLYPFLEQAALLRMSLPYRTDADKNEERRLQQVKLSTICYDFYCAVMPREMYDELTSDADTDNLYCGSLAIMVARTNPGIDWKTDSVLAQKMLKNFMKVFEMKQV